MSKPNIIFIITDQQRYDTIGALGYPHAQTPVVDRLVEQGTAFTRCYVAGATCVPARAALFTGYYPHTTGIMKNGDLWRQTWVQRFTDAGYHTVNIGKMHTEPMDTPAGFLERFNVENKERYRPAPGVNRDYLDEWDRALGTHGVPRPDMDYYKQLPDFAQRLGAFEWPHTPAMHPDVFTADLAMWWLDRKPTMQPLFLQVGFPGPHPPYDPLPGTAEPFLASDLQVRPVSQDDMDRQPPPIQTLRATHTEFTPDSTAHRADASMQDRTRQRAHYMANQAMIDQKIGELLDKLRDKGYLDDAIIVFTSDHGDTLGDHGLSQKWSCYEQVTRVPMVVHAPGRVPAGRKIDGLMQQQDIAQWLMEQADIAVPASLETESLSLALDPNAADDAFVGRDAVYCEQTGDRYMPADLMTMIRTPAWKLVHFLGEPFGQLFDLRNDPDEEHDLWDCADHAEIRAELIERLTNWRMRSQLQTADWSAEFR